MVKNTTGGTGTKSLARKHQKNTESKGVRLPEDTDLERFGCVTKMFGNGMCEITFDDKTTLLGHIRNKFRGKQKRHNLISLNALVMVGLREWENPRKSCDIIEMYEENQIEQLRGIPSVKIDNLVQLRIGTAFSSTTSTTDFDFAENNEIEEQPLPYKKTEEKFEITQGREIDFDDI